MTDIGTNATVLRQAPEAPSTSDLNLRYLFLVLWRQKLIIAATTMLLMAVASYVVLSLRPEYTATSTVVLDVREENVVNFESVLAGLPVDTRTVQTEMQVLGSRELASQVVDKLGLDRNPEFNASLRDPAEAPLLDRARALIKSVAGTLVAPASDGTKIPTTRRGAVIDTLAGKVKLQMVGESRAISVGITSWSPETAAAAANTLADLYVADRMEAKRSEAARANQWLSDQLVDVRRKAEESQRAVQAYRSEAGLILGDRNTTLPASEASRLTDELVKAKSARALAEARLGQVTTVIKSGGGIETVPEVMESSVVQALRQNEATLSADLAELSQYYGKNHPTILPVRQKLEEVRRSIRAETQRILSSLERQVEAARASEQGLADSLREMKGDLGASNRAQGELQILEAEAAANQMLLDTFLQRFKETAAEGSMHVPDARIVSRADLPANPSYPKKLQILLLSLAAALGLGIGLAFINEALDDTIRSMDQAEKGLGVTALGLVPALTGGQWRRTNPARYVVKRPRSAFAESLHRLHSGVMLSGGKAPRSILMTSSLPNEGKTTIAVSLGRLLALSNRKVIVVDADLRRPGVHKIVGVSGKRGLAECVAGTATVEDTIVRDRESTLDILPAGTIGNDAARIVGSDRLAAILKDLTRTYDVVLVDAAPVFAVDDARLISRMVDRTVYLVRWGRTRNAVAATGLKQMLEAGANIAGVLVTRVNVRRHALYGFADSGSYQGQLARYYVG